MGSFCILSSSFQRGQALPVFGHYSPLYGYNVFNHPFVYIQIAFPLSSYRQCCLNVIISHTLLYVHGLSSPKDVCSKFWPVQPADVLNVISNKCTKVLVFSASGPELKPIIRFSFCDFFCGKKYPIQFTVLTYTFHDQLNQFLLLLTICKSFPTLSFALNLIMLFFPCRQF